MSREQWKRIWLSRLHGRHKALLWRLLSDILPTKTRLGQIFPNTDPTCPLCNSAEESAIHLTLQCPFAIALWTNSKWQLRLYTFSHMPLIDWFMFILDLENTLPVPRKDKLEIAYFAVLVVEHTWLHRNKVMRGNPVPDLQRRSRTINSLAQLHLSAGDRPSPGHHLSSGLRPLLAPSNLSLMLRLIRT